MKPKRLPSTAPPLGEQRHPPRSPIARRVVSVREVAEALGISKAAAYDLVHRGHLGKPVRVGSHIRVTIAALDAFLGVDSS